MTDFLPLLNECRLDAAQVTNRHQKGASVQLYAVLAKAMQVCEICRYSIDNQERLRAIVAKPKSAGARRYVEQGSDIYTLTCRYVFDDVHRANGSRYAHALREAAKRQIRSGELFEYLKGQGGISELFLQRPLDARSISTKCLRLDRTITVPKAGTIALTLKRLGNGVFQVVGQDSGGER